MPFGNACATAATYSAFADEVSPDATRAGTSIPLRAMAVFKTARRLSEVEVVTDLGPAENSQCTRPSRLQNRTVTSSDSPQVCTRRNKCSGADSVGTNERII